MIIPSEKQKLFKWRHSSLCPTLIEATGNEAITMTSVKLIHLQLHIHVSLISIYNHGDTNTERMIPEFLD